MRPPAEYRAQAAECVRKAEYAKSQTHRMILLEAAQTWLRMADDAELTNKKLQTIEANTTPISDHPASSIMAEPAGTAGSR